MISLDQLETMDKRSLVIAMYELQKPDNLFLELKQFIIESNSFPAIMIYKDQAEAFIQGKTEDLVQYAVGIIKTACQGVKLDPIVVLSAVIADLNEERSEA